MKKIFVLFIIIVSFFSCNESYIKKPKKVIDKDEMVNIIYDLSLLEAIKTQSMGIPNNYPTATEFLKTKYKIDSVTFAENTKFYASDVEEYKKMYDEVKDKLKKKLDSENGLGRIVTPKEEEGIVK